MLQFKVSHTVDSSELEFILSFFLITYFGPVLH